MRVIIAGSRTFNDYRIVDAAIKHLKLDITVILSGNARGADQLGERYAKENNILIELYPAKWELYGKSAGYIRNKEMVGNADCLIAFWDGVSKGTGHTINLAKEKQLKVFVINVL